MNDDLLGRVLEEKYELVRLIGKGGMGVVYEARHVRLNRRVAVKILMKQAVTDDSTSVERFLREAQAASAIGHPNIVDVQDVGETEDGLHYIVMELLQGIPLDQHLEDAGRLGVGQALALVAQALAGLQAAHAKGIIHRDVKPANFHLVPDARGRNQLKILDFGISKVVAPGEEKVDLTRTGAVLGTPAYMSPEQARGRRNLDARADLWSVGIILYQMLVGERPFEGHSYNEILTRIVLDNVPPIADKVPDLPPEVVAIVDRTLNKDRRERFSDAGAFLAALAELSPRYPELAELDWLVPSGATITARDVAVAPTPASEPSTQVEAPVEAGRAPTTTRFDRPPPRWKNWLWYGLTVPLACCPLAAPQDIVGPGVTSVLGLPESTPLWGAYLLVALLCGGLLAAAVFVRRYWRSGQANQLLHGPLFIVFPAIGLLAAMRLHEQLQGQTTAFLASLGSYPAVDAAHAARMSELLGGVMRRYLNTVSLVMIALSLLALIILLGFVFVPAAPRQRPESETRWWTWLILPAGLVAVSLAYVVIPAPFEWMGPYWLGSILVLWLTSAALLLRHTRGLVEPLEHGWGVIRAGSLAMVAIATVAGLVGLAADVTVFSTTGPMGRAELVHRIGDMLLGSVLTLWTITVVLMVATIIVCRRGMGWFLAQSRNQRTRSVISTLAAVLAMMLPFYTIVSSAQAVVAAYEVPFARPALVEMVPMALADGESASFYIDREPASLARAPREFHRKLVGKGGAAALSSDQLVDLLSGSDTCGDVLKHSLEYGGDSSTPTYRPARCVTAIEANLYCQSRGKRLPTPEEWEAAFAAPGASRAQRAHLAEWTMKRVHGTTIFHVAGRHASLDLPTSVSPETPLPDLGFRCAFTFDDFVPE